jgi:hypothetical protein
MAVDPLSRPATPPREKDSIDPTTRVSGAMRVHGARTQNLEAWGFGSLIGAAVFFATSVPVVGLSLITEPPAWVQAVLGVGLATGSGLVAWAVSSAIKGSWDRSQAPSRMTRRSSREARAGLPIRPLLRSANLDREENMEDWKSHEVRTELERRARNEWIHETSDSFSAHIQFETYVCECGDAVCEQQVKMTRQEYESVRADGTHFALAIDHENPEIDRLLVENGRFAIVEKLGEAARMAQESNPRR